MHDPALKVPAVPLGIFIRTWPECHELKGGGVASARFLRFYLRDVRTMADEADTTAGRGFRGRDVAGQPLTTGLAGTAARLLAGRRGRSPPGLATPRFTTHVVVCAQQCTFRERPQRGDYAQMRVSSRDACPHTATSLPRGRQPGLRRAARRSRAHRGGGTLHAEPHSASMQTRPGPGFHVPRHRAGRVRPGMSPPALHVLGPQRSRFAFRRVPFLGVSGDTGHASSAKFERGGHRANAPLTVLWGGRNGLRPP